ncbi:Uncharacterised protein [uncultured archaeon]|nr:Uncharacterised protein [uncultured archaeon]
MKKLWAIFALALVIGIASAADTGITNVRSAISNLCNQLVTLLPVAAMLMIVIAGVIYAAGQMMGAETRARANVWATACLTGALVGLLIYAIAPAVLATIYGANNFSCNGTV